MAWTRRISPAALPMRPIASVYEPRTTRRPAPAAPTASVCSPGRASTSCRFASTCCTSWAENWPADAWASRAFCWHAAWSAFVSASASSSPSAPARCSSRRPGSGGAAPPRPHPNLSASSFRPATPEGDEVEVVAPQFRPRAQSPPGLWKGGGSASGSVSRTAGSLKSRGPCLYTLTGWQRHPSRSKWTKVGQRATTGRQNARPACSSPPPPRTD